MLCALKKKMWRFSQTEVHQHTLTHEFAHRFKDIRTNEKIITLFESPFNID